ncbi:RsmB/NOP family class I SAM-dependent RNA methyltransferase [Lactobacillus sp. PV034]|uniref:RsmB/NOP family class I SAM-dependent RNA methyltransferase n=1 Tax=Lactobacillus sp. PV034 TaxID=2594495 RepID=UPI00223F3CE0|nr:RsmF rRNA methyltransferase first C-terminal domain-containing protein [Lactobacillus sp. PV034]QNQ80400.1 methyltransferase domain-containing protein [Lactobacillus sp. PV034]
MLKLPTEFVEKYQKLLGLDESKKFFEAIEGENKKGFRLNPLKNDFKNVSYDLTHPVPGVDNAYYGNINGLSSEWTGGYVYSQDPSAMYPAQFAQVKPGEKVLDLCAAPGGKSTALAQALKGAGLLVANEISASRASNLRENLERWGASNVLVTNEDTESLAKVFPTYFDKIVVDAPCSGEGMFRKDPDAIQYWSQDYVLTCQKRQKDILNEAVKMLKPNGDLIYSTCTFSPEEDEEIVEWLSEKYNFKVLDLEKVAGMTSGVPKWTLNNFTDVEKTGRFWFQNGVGEGQFVAYLRKPGNESSSDNLDKKSKKRKNKKNKDDLPHLNKKERELVQKVLQDFTLPNSLTNWEKEALISKDHVFIPIIDPKVIKNLRILNNGVELGLMKKNRFEPGHQLAEVLGQLPQKKVVELKDEAEYRAYLHGETVHSDLPYRGYVLVAFEGHIFSFGKVGNDNILKNYYPKGLRK